MFIVAVTLRDVFVGVIVPRADNAILRISRYLARGLWKLWPRLAYRLFSDDLKRENFLGNFAPFALVVSLIVWVALLILGWGLFFYGIRDQLQPAHLTLEQILYFAGGLLLTVGSDMIGTTTLAHIMSLIAAASGLGVVAIVITYLFSIFGSFQRRETFIVAVGARAGAPPSGVGLLIEHAVAGIVPDLAQVFRDAQSWIAEVMESHLAYPILIFFRSSHDYQSWVGTLGTLMDASALTLTTIDAEANVQGQALILYSLARHLTHDFADYFELDEGDGNAGIERSEFEDACNKLSAAGHRVGDRDLAWRRFCDLRGKYAAQLNSLARWLEIPPVQWVGDRSLLKGHAAAATIH